MAEGFINTFKRDYVHINRLETAEQVLTQLPKWFEDYNEVHPHQGLKMRSPREYRKSLTAASGCPVLTGTTPTGLPLLCTRCIDLPGGQVRIIIKKTVQQSLKKKLREASRKALYRIIQWFGRQKISITILTQDTD